jgi:hypothetical protein
MSKQLAISVAFSVFAMAAFALFATPDAGNGIATMQTGAATNVTAPALKPVWPTLFSLLG